MKLLFKKKIKLILLSIINLFTNKFSLEYSFINFDRVYVIHKINKQKLGLLVQGPANDKFLSTHKILQYYRRLDNCEIVYSAHDISNQFLKYLRELEIEYINIETYNQKTWEYQFENTQAGLELLKRKGVEYALKTRSDQVLLNLNFPGILEQRLKISNDLGIHDERRIIFSSLNSFYKREFSFSDMFQYSRIDNLMSYWKKDGVDTQLVGEQTSKKWHEWTCPETILSKNYCSRCLGNEDLISYEKQLIGIVNREEIDQIWQKYRITSNQYLFDNIHNNQYTFSYWLNRIINK